MFGTFDLFGTFDPLGTFDFFRTFDLFWALHPFHTLRFPGPLHFFWFFGFFNTRFIALQPLMCVFQPAVVRTPVKIFVNAGQCLAERLPGCRGC